MPIYGGHGQGHNNNNNNSGPVHHHHQPPLPRMAGLDTDVRLPSLKELHFETSKRRASHLLSADTSAPALPPPPPQPAPSRGASGSRAGYSDGRGERERGEREWGSASGPVAANHTSTGLPPGPPHSTHPTQLGRLHVSVFVSLSTHVFILSVVICHPAIHYADHDASLLIRDPL
jgi:hypothetical protein